MGRLVARYWRSWMELPLGAAVLVAVLVIGLTPRCGSSTGPVAIDVTPDPAPPASDEVPAWARASDRGRRIAGRVSFDGHGVPARVHLRLDVPDPRVWRGRTVDADADGRFDFGALPAGRYLVVVPGPLTTSPVEVDTSRGDRARVAVVLAPCQPRTGQVSDARAGRPLANAAVEVAGLPVATTDARGEFALCGLAGAAHTEFRARGYLGARVDDGVLVSRGDDLTGVEEIDLHLLAGRLRRQLVDGADRPRAGVAVFPLRESRRPYLPTLRAAVQAITDEHGWIDAPWSIVDDDGEPREPMLAALIFDERAPSQHTLVDTTRVRAPDPRPAPMRIRGRVTVDGQPVVGEPVDAALDTDAHQWPSAQTLTDLDGAFELAWQHEGRVLLLTAGRQASVVLHDGQEVDLDLAFRAGDEPAPVRDPIAR